MAGYVKLWRKLLDSPIFTNHNLLVFWIWCLLKASHKEANIMVGYQSITLQPGQFVFGLYASSKETKLSIQKIRTCLLILKKLENITINTTNKYSIISIVNWRDYQEDITSNLTNSQQTNNKQITTNKNVKNDKNIKENNKKKSYGEFQNVYLLDEEVEKLKTAFNSHYQEKIEALSAYKKSKGKIYKDDYATILSWDRRDKKRNTDKSNFIPQKYQYINQ